MLGQFEAKTGGAARRAMVADERLSVHVCMLARFEDASQRTLAFVTFTCTVIPAEETLSASE